MAWIAGAAVLGSSLIGSQAAKKAGKAGTAAAADEVAFARESRDLARGDTLPYREGGYSAYEMLLRLTGVPVPTSVAEAAAPGDYEPGGGVFQPPREGAASEHDVVKTFVTYLGREPTPTELEYYSDRSRANQLWDNVVAPNQWKIDRQRAKSAKVKPGTQGSIADMVKADPSYQFRLDEGMRALERGAAARGGLLSGGFIRKGTRYAQDYASTEYGKIYDRIANIAGLGMTGAQSAGSAALQSGGLMANAASNAGYSRASGYVAQGNVWANAVNELGKIDWGGVFNRSGIEEIDTSGFPQRR